MKPVHIKRAADFRRVAPDPLGHPDQIARTKLLTDALQPTVGAERYL